MFTQRKKQCLTLTIHVYTVATSSVKKIVTNEWLRLNNSAFLMNCKKGVCQLLTYKKEHHHGNAEPWV
jgi:hypothetical protein